MASRRAPGIERSLLSKGFRGDDTHHRVLILYVHGEATDVRTFLSHGGKDYGDHLLAQMRRQLRLSSKQALLDLVDCPMSADDYVALLRDEGLI